MNSVQLIGRLTRDPEAEQTPGGLSVATFRLAVDRPTRDDADFITIKCWHRLANAVTEHLRRGRRVAVDGRLEHSEWTGANGDRFERLVVVANRVDFLDAPPAEGGKLQPARTASAGQAPSAATSAPAG